VRFHTRPCKRRLSRFGSGEAGIAAMAQPYRSKEAGAAPMQGQGHAAMSYAIMCFEYFWYINSLTVRKDYLE